MIPKGKEDRINVALETAAKRCLVDLKEVTGRVWKTDKDLYQQYTNPLAISISLNFYIEGSYNRIHRIYEMMDGKGYGSFGMHSIDDSGNHYRLTIQAWSVYERLDRGLQLSTELGII